MTLGMIVALGSAMGLIKGAIMSALLFVLGVSFLDQLIIASVSAALTSVGVIVASIITVRATQENRKVIQRATEDVKRTVREHADGIPQPDNGKDQDATT